MDVQACMKSSRVVSQEDKIGTDVHKH